MAANLDRAKQTASADYPVPDYFAHSVLAVGLTVGVMMAKAYFYIGRLLGEGDSPEACLADHGVTPEGAAQLITAAKINRSDAIVVGLAGRGTQCLAVVKNGERWTRWLTDPGARMRTMKEAEQVRDELMRDAAGDGGSDTWTVFSGRDNDSLKQMH